MPTTADLPTCSERSLHRGKFFILHSTWVIVEDGRTDGFPIPSAAHVRLVLSQERTACNDLVHHCGRPNHSSTFVLLVAQHRYLLAVHRRGDHGQADAVHCHAEKSLHHLHLGPVEFELAGVVLHPHRHSSRHRLLTRDASLPRPRCTDTIALPLT